jgi:hypothetical protein
MIKYSTVHACTKPHKRRLIKLSRNSLGNQLSEAENFLEDSTKLQLADKFLIQINNQSAARIFNKILAHSNYEGNLFVSNLGKWLDNFTLSDPGSDPNHEVGINLAFIISSILDLISWGGSIEISESQVWISKTRTEINDQQNSNRMRSAMSLLKKGEADYAAPIDSLSALKFLSSGHVYLEQASPSNLVSADIFRRGVTTWSMPYRGREGRSARFVLWCELEGKKLPIGIIEVGDDAPYSPLRDNALGFTTFDPAQVSPSKVADRLTKLRSAIRKEGLPIDPSLEISQFLKEWKELNLDSREVRDKTSNSSIKKRLSYLNRIVAGEVCLREIEPWDDKSIAAAIRAIKDVTLNRVHTEIVICGALPPFGNLLGGKLVAMMMNHPKVRATLDRDIGILLSESFDKKKLEEWLPRFGPLLATTKGLFPNHSSQYNRLKIPSSSGYIKLDKLGSTLGHTMSHISNRTMSFAVAINDLLGQNGISREYGSGGAKRQRILQKAAMTVGIEPEALYADVTRPVYGASYVENCQAVVLGGEEPRWKDQGMLKIVDEVYEDLALKLWRDKWLPKAIGRSTNIESGVTNND